jgi:LPXTG-motif cell wall-anchored protein
VNAYEIIKEENTPATAKNSQLIAVAGVVLVILIIALGYRSKNRDSYDDDGDYSL